MSTITPSRFGTLRDESFQLPVPGLLADLDSGSAALAMTDEFYETPASTRARILQQWMQEFRALKEAAVVEMFRAGSAERAGSTIVEQIDDFRLECMREGITCPAELPLLLQRY